MTAHIVSNISTFNARFHVLLSAHTIHVLILYFDSRFQTIQIPSNYLAFNLLQLVMLC